MKQINTASIIAIHSDSSKLNTNPIIKNGIATETAFNLINTVALTPDETLVKNSNYTTSII